MPGVELQRNPFRCGISVGKTILLHLLLPTKHGCTIFGRRVLCGATCTMKQQIASVSLFIFFSDCTFYLSETSMTSTSKRCQCNPTLAPVGSCTSIPGWRARERGREWGRERQLSTTHLSFSHRERERESSSKRGRKLWGVKNDQSFYESRLKGRKRPQRKGRKPEVAANTERERRYFFFFFFFFSWLPSL